MTIGGLLNTATDIAQNVDADSEFEEDTPAELVENQAQKTQSQESHEADQKQASPGQPECQMKMM